MNNIRIVFSHVSGSARYVTPCGCHGGPQTQRACRNTPNAALKFLVKRYERARSLPSSSEREARVRPNARDRRRPVNKAVSTRRTKTLTYNNYI